MSDTTRRIVIWGAAALASAALIWGGFFWRADADVLTHVGGAEMKLRFAAAMPATDKHGRPVPARAELLRQAKESLALARAADPALAELRELDAYCAFLEGRFEAAALAYAEAAAIAGRGTPAAEGHVINEARMWRAAKRPQNAILVLQRIGTFSPALREGALVERMQVCEELGRRDEALALAEDAAFGAGHAAMTRIAAGECLERAGAIDRAERAYEQARSETKLASYHAARLKIARGEIDNSLRLLEEAFAADPRQVRGLVREDERIWSAIGHEARFLKIVGAGAAASPSGR